VESDVLNCQAHIDDDVVGAEPAQAVVDLG
jgi:hypothetical protein